MCYNSIKIKKEFAMKKENANTLQKFSKFFGLHPLVGFGMFAADLMLFGVEAGTFEVGWLVTVPVAAFLTVPCVLIQKFSYKDDWGSSIGKGMLVGVLTAIPTALPSAIPFIGGVLGTINLLAPGRGEEEVEGSATEE
jgi:hypothetical protein